MPGAAAGRSRDGAPGPVPIIAHPDVRKMLLAGRAFIEAARALAVWTALQMDIAARHRTPRPSRSQCARGAADPGGEGRLHRLRLRDRRRAQQVFGGHGYIREWGMEQYVRDARIAQIYEGTNGVQAMDLVRPQAGLEAAKLATASSPSSGPTQGGGAAGRRGADVAGRRGAGAARSGDRAPGRGRAARGGCCRHRLPAPVRACRLRLDVARMAAASAAIGVAATPSKRERSSSPVSTWSACCHRRWRSPPLLPMTPEP